MIVMGDSARLASCGGMGREATAPGQHSEQQRRRSTPSPLCEKRETTARRRLVADPGSPWKVATSDQRRCRWQMLADRKG